VHVFAARRLIDQQEDKKALHNYVQALQYSPAVAGKVWYKGLQALGGALGLRKLFLTYRSSRRQVSHGKLQLTVDEAGVHWKEVE
jgi:hypothetical protein